MKKRFFLLSICLIAISFAKAPVIAVFADDATYARIPAAIDAYCASLAEEGYQVSFHAEAWPNPEAVRGVLQDLAVTTLPEGAVFIGDIPIVLIQDAQHMTSAFKIDQDRFTSMTRISVASDRYYDDLDLVFDYIGQDEEDPLLFYYSLSERSPQTVEKDFYSGRIYPPVHDDTKYAVIERYLTRVVEQKRRPEALDTVMTYTGHGYHSESLNSWENHSHMLREQFPNLYLPGGQVKNLYHTMSREMKAVVMKEVQDPQLDMAIFHAHGGDDAQYLIGFPAAANAKENVEEVKRFVRSKLRTAKERGNYDESKKYYLENYDIPEHWIADTFDEAVIREDSLYNALLDIYSDDVKTLRPEADVIVFDECYNGQFFVENYISGNYVFGNGSTVAGIANSVNVRQDIWANELLGLLRHGVPVGTWHLSRNYLESHIIGDPTFHFAKPARTDVYAPYRKLLKSPDASLRSYGVYQLAKDRGMAAESALIGIYSADPSANVRLQALKSLASLRTPGFRKLLETSVKDPSELIRRISANWMGHIGDKGYIPVLADRWAADISERVSFSAKSSLELLFAHPCADDFLAEIAETNGLDTARINYQYRRSQSWLNDELIPTITDKSLTAKKRMSKVRTFRNYNFTPGVKTLIEIAQDESDDPIVRVGVIEALGWFVMNPNYKELIGELEAVLDSEVPEVKAEAVKSIRRLEEGPNMVVTP